MARSSRDAAVGGAYEALVKAQKRACKRLAEIGRLLKRTREFVYIVEDRKHIREVVEDAGVVREYPKPEKDR